ncbi:hypothetical protein TNCV_791361 [Trichonephila clavipes]|nr:hypothetical protein TNCV_791361 [Trichonephila clavipes]
MRVGSVYHLDCRRQLIWRGGGTAYRPEKYQKKDRYPDMQYHGVGRHHDQCPQAPTCVVANGLMTGQRYIDEVLLPHVRLFRGAVGDKFVLMDDNATLSSNTRCSVLSRQRSATSVCKRLTSASVLIAPDVYIRLSSEVRYFLCCYPYIYSEGFGMQLKGACDCLCVVFTCFGLFCFVIPFNLPSFDTPDALVYGLNGGIGERDHFSGCARARPSVVITPLVGTSHNLRKRSLHVKLNTSHINTPIFLFTWVGSNVCVTGREGHIQIKFKNSLYPFSGFGVAAKFPIQKVPHIRSPGFRKALLEMKNNISIHRMQNNASNNSQIYAQKDKSQANFTDYISEAAD